MAAYDVGDLDPTGPQAEFDRLAAGIVGNLAPSGIDTDGV
ncbi:hypothetical protein EDD98_4725 [Streptomyces sp. PanSC19]|nr:hypothetical protein EDD98_4725 [Streptomyces sp. PanSC19]